ncbi:HAD-IIB family hydrolase [uncultured Parolsenella sp.]|uniref:HAD-IIB family hydrolase n=1 Tax=uncultured Parolsenella sp. TaxID=2083008 RepID=UPI0027DB2DE1|nr:HAD-IIB family hydrolase [uncultured Parolsenella sp.]
MPTSHPTFPTRPTGELAERLRKVRYVITDADGTMFTGAKATVNTAGEPSAELVETLVELTKAGVGVIPCTGRNRAMIQEDARVLGFPGWIAEMGGVLCTRQSSNPEWHYFTGTMPYDEASGKTPHDVICETGVIDEVLARWPGHLETYHDNGIGFEYREVTVALRGDAPEDDIQDMLDHSGLPLYLSDNGMVNHISGASELVCDHAHPEGIHTYHITPAGVSKGSGILRFIELAGLEPDEVLGAGDSPADCVIADAVGTFLFMCNGLGHERAEEELAARDNILISTKRATDGWVAAMRGLLAAKE